MDFCCVLFNCGEAAETMISFVFCTTGLCFKEVKSFVPFPRRDSKRKNTLTMSP